MKKHIFSFTLFLFLVPLLSAFAQNGAIRGQIFDDQTGEELIGATVVIAGTTNGVVTDLDGKFTIQNLQEGAYDVQVSFVSYQNQIVKNVAVKANSPAVLNIRLKSADIGLDEVVVEAKVIKNSENALLTVQKKASTVLDAISSEQFSKTGDSDAGAALRRVTGVSVEGGKYVLVRGLGDRYSKTVLNSAEIPGLDPNKNTVQMDLIPSNLIDNLIVYKTFSPDLPGSFTGGFVNVTTKDFPDRFTFQLSGSVGYNAQSTFNSGFLTQKNSNTHFLGFDNGRRSIPTEAQGRIPNISYSNEQDARKLTGISRSFNKEMEPSSKTPFLNHNLSLSLGNQKDVFGKPFGFILGLSYQRNFEYYDNGTTGRYYLPGDINAARLENLLQFNDEAGTESTLWGAMINTSYKLSKNSKISLNLLRNQGGETLSRFQQGKFPLNSGYDNDTAQYQTRTLAYIERSLSTAQLKGEHALGNSDNPIKVDWLTAATYSTQNEPDLRFFTNDLLLTNEGKTQYFISPTLYSEPARYFREMDEYNYDNKVNITIPVKKSKLKVGASYVMKDRNFDERIFIYRKQNVQYNGSVADYISDENLGVRNDDYSTTPFTYGSVIQDLSVKAHSYFGYESVLGAYAMIDLSVTKKLKAAFGVRYEKTDIEVKSKDKLKKKGILNNNDFLPALNLTYQLKEEMNLRAAYGRTLARPTFRELAPYATFDFIGDFFLLGNPNLKRTTIDNYDLRWEYFPQSGEYLSVSAFYKDFTNPIERAINPVATNVELNYRNVPKAFASGVEFEIRKSLGFLAPTLSNLKLGTNVTLVYSEVDIAKDELQRIRVNDPGASARRVMSGQSPYIINASLGYANEKKTNINLSYNVLGKRLAVVSVGGMPNVYELPRNMLDLNIQQGIKKNFSVKLSAQNLLNAQYKLTHQFRGQDYIYQSSRLGATYSIGFKYLIN